MKMTLVALLTCARRSTMVDIGPEELWGLMMFFGIPVCVGIILAIILARYDHRDTCTGEQYEVDHYGMTVLMGTIGISSVVWLVILGVRGIMTLLGKPWFT